MGQELTGASVGENGNTLNFKNVKYSMEDGYYTPNYNEEGYYEYDGNTTQPIITGLDNIDTVIFCTGYKANTDMLESSLQGSILSHNKSLHPEFQVHPNWTMEENILTPWLGR